MFISFCFKDSLDFDYTLRRSNFGLLWSLILCRNSDYNLKKSFEIFAFIDVCLRFENFLTDYSQCKHYFR